MSVFAPVSKLGNFYEEVIHDHLEKSGNVRVKLTNIPFGVNNRKLSELKEIVATNFGPNFIIEKTSDTLVIDLSHGPAPCRKTHRPAYVNNR